MNTWTPACIRNFKRVGCSLASTLFSNPHAERTKWQKALLSKLENCWGKTPA